MKETERDKFDKLFQDKLQDFEATPMVDDWDIIAKRLPQNNVVPFMRILKYVAAAAIISFIVVTAALIFNEKEIQTSPLTQKVPSIQNKIEKSEKELIQHIFDEKNSKEKDSTATITFQQTQIRPITAKAVLPVKKENIEVSETNSEEAFSTIKANEAEKGVSSGDEKNEELVLTKSVTENSSPVSDSPSQDIYTASSMKSTQAGASKRKSKGWSFGMGGGSLSAGSSNTATFGGFGTRSQYVVGNGLALMNMSVVSDKPIETNIKHHTPVSIGFSVSKRLNDRFALQSGIVYTYLSSEWETEGVYGEKTKQKLHYLGIPLSAVYKIAEWNRFFVYASAGGMGEVNVAGKRKTNVYSPRKVEKTSQKVRMDELLWSVNANVGISYPIVRFINVFAQTGVSYYFDNGSSIATVRSEKPFNVDFQLGFRFGF